ncbi:hypothetical protein ACFCX0_14175 [Streptomyces sp. NPDC056352]|uniref:hypothetical protein n=1 Tax=Streptomyces sp. NPDC056352 TaxID=3345791 RepID=UPI0035D77992
MGVQPPLQQELELESVLGRGVMGQVWRGRDLYLERPVAVKTIASELLAVPRSRDEALARFKREAQAAACLDHSNITTVHDASITDDICCPVMQLATERPWNTSSTSRRTNGSTCPRRRPSPPSCAPGCRPPTPPASSIVTSRRSGGLLVQAEVDFVCVRLVVQLAQPVDALGPGEQADGVAVGEGAEGALF